MDYDPDRTRIDFIQKILACTLPMLAPDETLSHSVLDKVFVGQSKESLSVVDEKLVINDVCRVFGQHVKFVVLQAEAVTEAETTSSQTYRNAFTVLMNSRRALEKSIKRLPAMKEERTKKDKLFNDIIRLLERENWTWTTGGDTHGKQFVTQLHECLWYIDGHHHTFAGCSHPIPSIFKAFSGYNTPEFLSIGSDHIQT